MRRAFRMAAALAAAVGTLACVPEPATVRFPGGTCPTGALIEYQTFGYDQACVSRCPTTQGVKDPACVETCWRLAEDRLVPRNACVEFADTTALQGLRVRCVTPTATGTWVTGLSGKTASLGSCSTVLQ